MKRLTLAAMLMVAATSAFGPSYALRAIEGRQGTFPPASFKNLQVLPKDARIVHFNGRVKGWDLKHIPWIKSHSV